MSLSSILPFLICSQCLQRQSMWRILNNQICRRKNQSWVMLSNGSEEKNLRTLGSICCQQECKRTWIKSWIDIPLAHMAYIIFLKNAWYCSGSWSYHSSICILSGRDHFNWSDPNHHPGSWLFCTINSLSYWLTIKCMIFFL